MSFWLGDVINSTNSPSRNVFVVLSFVMVWGCRTLWFAELVLTDGLDWGWCERAWWWRPDRSPLRTRPREHASLQDRHTASYTCTVTSSSIKPDMCMWLTRWLAIYFIWLNNNLHAGTLVWQETEKSFSFSCTLPLHLCQSHIIHVYHCCILGSYFSSPWWGLLYCVSDPDGGVPFIGSCSAGRADSSC